jgi:hypothetical protein
VHESARVFHNRVLLFYANDLAIPVPPQLDSALDELPADFRNDERVATFYWGMIAPGATATVGYDATAPWTAIEDPDFASGIARTMGATLPFLTQLHDDGTMVPLLDTTALIAEGGGELKLCQASPPVLLAAGGIPARGLTVPITAASPPGFFVSLPPQITVPHAMFVQADVVVRYEICRRFCDHPFTNDAGLDGAAWRSSRECVHNHVP